MGYHVKNVKSFEGREGYGFSATLYRGKKRIAKVVDEGNGGSMFFHWEDPSEQEAFLSHAVESEGAEEHFAKDMAVARLVDEYENNKRLKSHCKDKTVVKFKGDEELRVFKVKYSDEVKSKLYEKYGEDIEEIVNERFAPCA